MRVYNLSAILLTMLLTVSLMDIAAAQTAEGMRGISVSGTAEIQAAPDIAYVTVGARTRAAQANQAASENATAVRQVTQAIRQLGIAETDIETVQYTLQPVFEYPPNEPPRQTGYEATNLVRVTVRDLSKVGQVIDVAVRAGANIVQDVAFALRNESEFRARALRQAVADARAKASVMANALGVRLGNLISASESTGPIVFPRIAVAEAAAGAQTPISPRQVQIQATVNLVYAIRQ